MLSYTLRIVRGRESSGYRCSNSPTVDQQQFESHFGYSRSSCLCKAHIIPCGLQWFITSWLHAELARLINGSLWDHCNEDTFWWVIIITARLRLLLFHALQKKNNSIMCVTARRPLTPSTEVSGDIKGYHDRAAQEKPRPKGMMWFFHTLPRDIKWGMPFYTSCLHHSFSRMNVMSFPSFFSRCRYDWCIEWDCRKTCRQY